MDVPVVTFAGYNFCSRTGASILQNLGHKAMVAETPGGLYRCGRRSHK